MAVIGTGPQGAHALIDLHCHLLPGIDDGPPEMDMSVAMARLAVADGVKTMVCTPHILPGLFENNGVAIRGHVARMQKVLDDEGIPLSLSTGADVHLVPGLASELADGRALTIADTRYFLLEPPHHVEPPRLKDSVFELMVAGYVPIITHPERLTWINDRYEVFVDLARAGCWMQLTAGAITGRFGGAAKMWADRMLDDGLVDVVASDAHDTGSRKPGLSKARRMVTERLGEAEADQIFDIRPQAVLANADPGRVSRPVGRPKPKKSFFSWGRRA
jgi:protein-tyrosine phosphatase